MTSPISDEVAGWMLHEAGNDAAVIVHLFSSPDPAAPMRLILEEEWDFTRSTAALIALAGIVASGASDALLLAIQANVEQHGTLWGDR